MRVLPRHWRRVGACLIVAATACTLAPAESAQAGSDPLDAASHDVTLSVEPADGYAPILDFIRSARHTLDFTIYQFNDGRIARALMAAQDRGVDVRVTFTWQVFPAGSNLSDPTSDTYNTNMPTYYSLRKAGIAVHLSPFPYTYSHEKTMIADGHTASGRALIMDFNAQPSYLEPTPAWHEIGTRGFAITTRDQADVREIQSVFDADWSRQTPGPLTSSHLVWSPNGAGYAPAAQGKERIFALMDSARRSLDVYALLLDYRPFLDRLAAAARRGVTVRVISNTSPAALTVSQLQNLTSAGVQFAFTPEYPGGSLFIHTKAMIRDAGTSQAMAFVGSENPGDHVSMNSERELGILVGTPAIVQRMHGVFTADWQHAKPVEVVNGRVVDPFHG